MKTSDMVGNEITIGSQVFFPYIKKNNIFMLEGEIKGISSSGVIAVYPLTKLDMVKNSNFTINPKISLSKNRPVKYPNLINEGDYVYYSQDYYNGFTPVISVGTVITRIRVNIPHRPKSLEYMVKNLKDKNTMEIRKENCKKITEEQATLFKLKEN